MGINVPFAHFGGGFAEGALAGSDMMGNILDRRQARQDSVQKDERERLMGALKLLQAAPAMAEENPQMAEALVNLSRQMIPPKYAGMLPPNIQFDPAGGAQREAAKKGQSIQALTKQAQAMGYQPGSAEFEQFVHGKVLTEKKERSPYVINGVAYMLTEEQKARFAQQEQMAQLVAALRGGGHGGGGRGGEGGGTKGMIPWQDPTTGKFLGFAPKTAPPAKDAVPATASSFKPAQQKITPFTPSDLPILKDIVKRADQGILDPWEQKMLEDQGWKFESYQHKTTPLFGSSKEVTKTRAVPPRGKMVPPQAGGGGQVEDEWVNE